MHPLFNYYPRLRDKLSYINLGNFPTPINKLVNLGKAVDSNSLYIKRDDLSSTKYGGNKVRKLEFILEHVQQCKKRVLITFGLVGSNHALATTIYAKQIDVKCILMLLPQPNARYVQRNLLLDYHYGADLHLNSNVLFLAISTLKQIIRSIVRVGYIPYIIPPGGSSVYGVTGFINAAFELKEQIQGGIIPEPDYIYVPLGSMGTAIGLMIGLKAAGLSSQVIAVRVVDNKYANLIKMMKLFKRVNAFLHSHDSSFPLFRVSKNDFNLRDEFFGEKYGLFTEAGVAAASLIEKQENIELDGTYTAKTLAAVINDIKEERTSGKTILFWNTYNSSKLIDRVSNIDYQDLPRKFHSYFEQQVQQLDRG